MTGDQYTELVAFLGRKFEEGRRHSTALCEQSREDLRTAVEGLDVRLGRVETRLDKVETRLGRVEIRLDKVEARLGRVEIRLDKVEARLGRVEIRLDNVEGTLISLEGWARRTVGDHEARTQALE